MSSRPGRLLIAALASVSGLALAEMSWGQSPPHHLRQWVRPFFHPEPGHDQCADVQVDRRGAAVVTGQSWGGPVLQEDVLTRKYGPRGDLLWSRRLDRLGRESGQACALDMHGNTYVAGSGSTGFLVIKYDPQGNELWFREPGLAAASSGGSMDVDLDGAGNVYVCGTASGSTLDLVVFKYGADGTLAWTTTFDSGFNDWGRRLQVTRQALVVVGTAGLSRTDSGILTARYDPGGGLQWSRIFSKAGATGGSGHAIEIDREGSVISAGSVFGAGTGVDAALVKYDHSGALLWDAQYRGPSIGFDDFRDLAVDRDDNIYLTGMTEPDVLPGDTDVLIARYSPHGKQLWVAHHDGPAGSNDVGVAIAVDRRGLAFVTGNESAGNRGLNLVTLAYGPHGHRFWRDSYNRHPGTADYSASLVLDRHGNLYVAGVADRNPEPDVDYGYVLIKYRPRPEGSFSLLR